MAKADGRHAVAIRDAALFARLKVSAARAKRPVQTQLAVLLEEALQREGMQAGHAGTVPVVTGPTGPVTVPSVCRRCGHEARKHEPSCIMMGCPCRKFQ
jgi:hypothetical protein